MAEVKFNKDITLKAAHGSGLVLGRRQMAKFLIDEGFLDADMLTCVLEDEFNKQKET
jgi:hypothetical protein